MNLGIPQLALLGIVGAIAGVVLLGLGVLTLQLLDVHNRMKDDGPFHRQVWLYITIGPKHVYYQTDWALIRRIAVYAALIGSVAAAVLTIFAVGLLEVIG
jgi:hypothetical protein